MRRIVPLILCLALVLSACAKGAPAPSATPIISTPPPKDAIEAQQGQRLTVALCGVIGALHPLLSREKEARSLMGLMFESLVETDAQGELAPCLAASWSCTADKTWAFRLRPQVTWQGSLGDFTAEDVIFTLDLIRSIGDKGPYAYLLEAIASWRAIGQDTVELTFSGGSYASLYLLDFPILPKAGGYTATEAPRLLPGSGPFQIRDFPQEGQILLERNAGWWKVAPTIEEILVQPYTNLDAAASALSLRQLDAAETASLTTDQYKYGNTVNVFEYTTNELECLYLNLSTYVLQNRYLRQAISYALDRSGIAETAYIRHAVVADTPVAPGSPLNRGVPLHYVYDPDEARRLIARTGWRDADGDGILDTAPSGSEQKMTLRVVASDSAAREDAATAIVRQLRAVGFDAELFVLPREDYEKAIEDRNFDLLLAGVYLDGAPEYTKLLGTDEALNLSRYSDAEMDRLLAECRDAASEDELLEATQALRTAYLDAQPMICLFYRSHSLLLSNHVEGVSLARDGDAYCDIASWVLQRSGK